MAYFDDPAHKAQWERELAALREERQRRMASGPARVRRGGQEPARTEPERSARLPSFEELVRQAGERRENKGLRKPEEQAEVPLKNHPEKTVPRGTIRERITFSQLLAEEDRRQLTAAAGAGKQRVMEAGNAL